MIVLTAAMSERLRTRRQDPCVVVGSSRHCHHTQAKFVLVPCSGYICNHKLIDCINGSWNAMMLVCILIRTTALRKHTGHAADSRARHERPFSYIVACTAATAGQQPTRAL